MEKQIIINETNAVRDIYKKHKHFDSIFFQDLYTSITNTKLLLSKDCTQYFLQDLEWSISNYKFKLDYTKKYINNSNDDFIFSMFHVPYAPKLSIESFFFERLMISKSLTDQYHTNVVPVNIKTHSQGFNFKLTVAIFPENHLDGIQYNTDKIFYFINRFVDRYFNITHKVINNIVVCDSFNELKRGGYIEVEKAALHWVWLHEYFHHQGSLPLPKYLRLKSKKQLAGLEELRVDLCSMIACLDDSKLCGEFAKFTYQFILAERLLRYGVEGSTIITYDALSSYLFFNFLLKHDAININNDKIRINKNIVSVLKMLLHDIENIEANILNNNELSVQDQLLTFANTYLTLYGDSTINYFKRIRQYVQGK